MTLRPTYRSPIEGEPDFARADPGYRCRLAGGSARASAPAAPREERMSRIGLLIAGAGALIITFIQQPGKIVDDTKLELVMSPLTFMANSLHLWNPIQSSGTLQTETFGYLVPMGPFFGLGEALHVPVWITERVWLAILLTVSFWGVVRLAEALGITGRGAKVAGAVAYTIAPIVVTNAATSAALLAVVLLPWVLVPLVRGAAGGSPRPRRRRIRDSHRADGRRERHRRAGDTPRPGHLAAHPPERPSSTCPDGVVGRRRGVGLLLVGRRTLPPGALRVQLPSLHRDLGGHHRHGLAVRSGAGCVLLDRLFHAGRTADPRNLGAHLHGPRHHRHLGGGRSRPGRIVVAGHPRAALLGDHPLRSGSWPLPSAMPGPWEARSRTRPRRCWSTRSACCATSASSLRTSRCRWRWDWRISYRRFDGDCWPIGPARNYDSRGRW